MCEQELSPFVFSPFCKRLQSSQIFPAGRQQADRNTSQEYVRHGRTSVSLCNGAYIRISHYFLARCLRFILQSAGGIWKPTERHTAAPGRSFSNKVRALCVGLPCRISIWHFVTLSCRTLALGYNAFTGSLPPEFGLLRSLL